MSNPQADLVLMEFGRSLIRKAARDGRWGSLVLTDTDIDRGARAVVLDPHYRSDVGANAARWAAAHGDAVDAAIVAEALDRLAENDRIGRE